MPRIYCIEGYHNFQPDTETDWEVNTLVRGQLQAVREAGGLDFLHRTCGTVDEMLFRIGREWLQTNKDGKGNFLNLVTTARGNVQPHDPGSILYVSAHGGSAQICLSDGSPFFEDQSITINQLSELVGEGFAKGCVVHLAGCGTVLDCEPKIKDFMLHSGAVAVSGYTREVWWLDAKSPGLACDAIYLVEVSWVDGLHNLANRGQAGDERRTTMCEIAAQLRDSFPTVGFRLWLRERDEIYEARLVH